MYYEKLYEKAYSGDLSALKELESEAGKGNAEAQLPLNYKYQYGFTNKEEEEAKYKDIKPGGIWSIRGRIDRTTYLVFSILYISMYAFLMYFIAEQPGPFALDAEIALRLVAGYLLFALQSKRAHDCGRPCLMTLIPFFGIFFAIYLLFKEGEPCTNQYGPQPD